MNTWIKGLSICLLAVGLSACSKKSNKGSTVATTPTPSVTCTQNQYGQWVNGSGQACTPNSSSSCRYNTTTKRYEDINTGQVCQSVGNGGCDSYYYQYGVQYFPMQINGQLVCLRADLVGQHIPFGGYGQNYYACTWGDPYCNNYSQGGGGCVNIGGQNWGSQYGLSGQIGFCW